MTTPFRNDADALRTRLSSLDEELKDLRSKATELDAVKQRLERVEKEHAEVLEEIDARASGRKAPLLDSLKIASPCHESWDAMVGDDRTRFCGKCQTNVHNISEMPRAEAEAFLQSVAGPVCIRMYKRTDGTVLTADCPVGVRKKRVKRLFLATIGTGLAAAAGAVAFWKFEEATVMGEMVMPTAVTMGTAAPSVEPAPSTPQFPTPPPTTFATPPDPNLRIVMGTTGREEPETPPSTPTTTPAKNKFGVPPSPRR
ncbi:MAG: hypothetical protein U0441_21320 [Polyangiaceae bacterium]